MTSTAHAVYKAEELSRQRGLATHTRIRLEISFHTLSSWAHGLMGHNQTLVPTWLPSDGNRTAGLAASPADELQTRLHRPALPDYDARTKLATRQDIHIDLRLVPKTSATSSLSAINTQLSCEYTGK